MPRNLTIAAAQLGPISRNETRASVVKRMKDLMSEAKARGSELVAFPELALTSFFPRWYMEDWREADAFFETTMTSQETPPLFDHARSLGLAFSFGYAELSQGAVLQRLELFWRSGVGGVSPGLAEHRIGSRSLPGKAGASEMSEGRRRQEAR